MTERINQSSTALHVEVRAFLWLEPEDLNNAPSVEQAAQNVLGHTGAEVDEVSVFGEAER